MYVLYLLVLPKWACAAMDMCTQAGSHTHIYTQDRCERGGWMEIKDAVVKEHLLADPKQKLHYEREARKKERYAHK